MQEGIVNYMLVKAYQYPILCDRLILQKRHAAGWRVDGYLPLVTLYIPGEI